MSEVRAAAVLIPLSARRALVSIPASSLRSTGLIIVPAILGMLSGLSRCSGAWLSWRIHDMESGAPAARNSCREEVAKCLSSVLIFAARKDGSSGSGGNDVRRSGT